MIQASFKQSKDKKWISYEINGHANFAQHGEDIVCAAVSSLSIATVNGIERLAKYQPLCEVDDDYGGYLYVEILPDLTNEQDNITQILIENLYLSLKEDIMVQYPNFINVEIVYS